MGTKVNATAAELDAVNLGITGLVAYLEENAPNIRLIGILMEIPNEHNQPGIYSIPAPAMDPMQFAQILVEMGQWIKSREVQ